MKTSAISETICKTTNSVYRYVTVESGKTVFGFMVRTIESRIDYVSVAKLSSNPFMTAGARFESFDAAQERYKSPLVKTMILLAESLLK
jgi:hypothetical protein